MHERLDGLGERAVPAGVEMNRILLGVADDAVEVEQLGATASAASANCAPSVRDFAAIVSYSAASGPVVRIGGGQTSSTGGVRPSRPHSAARTTPTRDAHAMATSAAESRYRSERSFVPR